MKKYLFDITISIPLLLGLSFLKFTTGWNLNGETIFCVGFPFEFLRYHQTGQLISSLYMIDYYSLLLNFVISLSVILFIYFGYRYCRMPKIFYYYMLLWGYCIQIVNFLSSWHEPAWWRILLCFLFTVIIWYNFMFALNSMMFKSFQYLVKKISLQTISPSSGKLIRVLDMILFSPLLYAVLSGKFFFNMNTDYNLIFNTFIFLTEFGLIYYCCCRMMLKYIYYNIIACGYLLLIFSKASEFYFNDPLQKELSIALAVILSYHLLFCLVAVGLKIYQQKFTSKTTALL